MGEPRIVTTSDHAPQYDAWCLACRRASGRPDSGVTTECRWHQVERLTRERDEAKAWCACGDQITTSGLCGVCASALESERDEALDRGRRWATVEMRQERDAMQAQIDTLTALLREVQACDVIYGQRDTWTVVLPDRLCQAIRTALEGHDAK